MTASVTGLVLTYNGERLLADCLRSLSLCSSILVVDSQSEDSTREIAEKHGAKVLVNPWQGPLAQFAFALNYIQKTGADWVISLDQDESLSPELAASIRQTLAKDEAGELPGNLAGFWCPRRSFYFNRFLKHSGWYPDRLLRMFRPGLMEVRASGPHYSFHPLGPTQKLRGDIVHYPYQDMQEHLDKVNYYTQEAAKDLVAKGRRPGLFTALAHGVGRFLRIYIWKRGFLDGRAGLIMAVHAFMYGFLKYARAAEILEKEKEKTGS